MAFKSINRLRFNEATGHIISKSKLKEYLYDSLRPDNCSDVTRSTHLGVSKFRDTYAYQCAFNKYNDGTTAGSDRLRENCKQKWLQCERSCLRTNYRFHAKLMRDDTMEMISIASRIISEILGPFRVEYLTDYCSWGPGASTGKSRMYGDAAFKFGESTHVTSLYHDFAKEWIANSLWKTDFVIRDHADFMTVPKNKDTDRPIEPQVDFVLLPQKSMGTTIRRKMKGLPVDATTKLDLNSQEVNRRLAREGSITGLLATIDLSSASDLICLMLVNRLLDQEWFHALWLCRVGKTDVDGTIHNLEKFSSMGNGYTWELQSLIFYALVRAVYEYTGYHGDIVTAVFGDDIICRSEIVPTLITLFEDIGLKINTDKSYWEGNFRESCGKHYYKGMDVSPFYIRRPLSDSFEIAKFHNRLVEWQYTAGYRDVRLKNLTDFLAQSIKGQPFSNPVPLGFGDVGLISCIDDIRHIRKLRYRRQHVVKRKSGDYTREGYLFMGTQITKSRATFTHEGVLVKRLFAQSDEEISASDIPFGNEWIIDQTYNSHVWPWLGCWL